jgi:hypothetical protein
MSRRAAVIAGWIRAGAVAGIAVQTPAAPAPPPVELPPLVVEESAGLPPWLYVQADGTEYLSRCTEATTRDYVEMQRRRLEWVRALVPPEFLARSDVPAVTILASQRHRAGTPAEVVGEVQRLQRDAEDGTLRRATTAPNMLLTDVDALGVFALIDEDAFNAEGLTVSADHLQLLLEARRPALPRWLIAGVMGAYRQVRFDESPLTLGPMAWHAQTELQALVRDHFAARTLVPLGDLLGNTGLAERHPGIARVQATLFVRWALDPRHGRRDGFWKLAAQAAEAPVTDAMLEATLGVRSADLRDRLSDYVATAVREPLLLPLPAAAAAGRPEIRRATPSEVARLKGEWERMAVALVRERQPAHVTRYLGQARRTLQRAYDGGDRDARLVASLGLCELEAGNRTEARERFETALALGVVRPRVGLELARLRWGDLTRGQPETRQFEPAEILPVLAPLRAALAQRPLTVGAAELWADAWARTGLAPTAEEVASLTATARHFVSEPGVVLRTVRALARHGRRAEATELLGAGFLFARDDATRRRFAQMLTAVEARQAP